MNDKNTGCKWEPDPKEGMWITSCGESIDPDLFNPNEMVDNNLGKCPSCGGDMWNEMENTRMGRVWNYSIGASMRPDVMEGVPEEPGWYWVKSPGSNGWEMKYVKYEYGTLKVVGGTWQSLKRYSFSKQIQPPVEGE